MKTMLKAKLSPKNGIKVWATDHETDVKSNLAPVCAKAKNMKTQFSETFAITETTSHKCLALLCQNISHPFDVV